MVITTACGSSDAAQVDGCRAAGAASSHVILVFARRLL